MKTQKILIILFLVFLFVGCNEPLNITTIGIISLHDAVISNNIGKVKSDILRGAWIDSKNESGWTALHYAVVKNNPEMIQLLIKSDADINKKDKKRGQTPLHFAAMTEKKEAVELLLANNADPKIKDINKKTPKQLTSDKNILDLFHKYGY